MLPLQNRLERLKLFYYSLISNFSKYYFKTGTICLLSYLHASEFDNNHFGILLWKIEKLRDQNEIKQPIEKTFRIRHYFVMPWNQLSCSFVNKVYDNYNKVSYLQKE